MAKKIIVGDKFDRLTVIALTDSASYVIVKCSCGLKAKKLWVYSLLDGRVKSCGCKKAEFLAKDSTRQLSLASIANARKNRALYNQHVSLGQVFDRLEVVSYTDSVARVLVRCTCGTAPITNVETRKLLAGKIISCGCRQKELLRSRATKHGMYKHKYFDTWVGIIYRCYDPDSSGYHNYGGRGITVCSSWRDSPIEFLKWVDAQNPEEGLTVERKNNSKGYSPSNCKFATKKEQSRNRRPNRIISTPKGEMCIAQAAEEFGFTKSCFYFRVWNWPERRWFEPMHESKRRHTS